MSDDTAVVDPAAQVSHEVNGRILTGVGVSVDDLAEVMDRHAPEEAPAAPAQPEAPAPAPSAPVVDEKPTRGRARFAELTARSKAAEERAAALERERDEWKAKASQAPAVPQSSSPAAVPSSASVPNAGDSGRSQPASTRAQPSEDEVGTKYKTYAEFVVDSARWVAEQQSSDIDARVRASIEADRASRGFQSRVDEVFSKGRAAYPDFDAVQKNGPGAQVPFTHDRVQALISHPAAEHLYVAIARDAALAQRLATADPITFGMELARLAPNGAGASPASPAVPGVVAPVPYQPVGASTKTTVTPLTELPKKFGHDFDQSGYAERRRAERAQRRR